MTLAAYHSDLAKSTDPAMAEKVQRALEDVKDSMRRSFNEMIGEVGETRSEILETKAELKALQKEKDQREDERISAPSPMPNMSPASLKPGAKRGRENDYAVTNPSHDVFRPRSLFSSSSSSNQ